VRSPGWSTPGDGETFYRSRPLENTRIVVHFSESSKDGACNDDGYTNETGRNLFLLLGEKVRMRGLAEE
jgi:hypothetical protein